MKRARALLPYALVSAGVILVSAISLSPAVLDAAPAAAPRPSPRAELSDTGRMTYWKQISDSQVELWVSDLDGRRAWPLRREPATLDIRSTRWSPDGSSVAYIRGNTSIAIAGIDGLGHFFRVPYTLLRENMRIAGYSLSPSGSSLALTLETLGRSRTSDVYVVEVLRERRFRIGENEPAPLVGGPPWKRVTEIGDAFAGRWISESEMFIETRGGMIGRLNVETKELWPVSGMRAASPLIASDGRLYFAGGGWVHTDAAGGPWANGGIWSAALDGGDARREVEIELQSVRLLGRLSDGRFVLAAPGSSYVVGDELRPTPWQAGTIRRVIVSTDGTDAIGVTDTRVVRVITSKIPDSSGANPPPESVSTLLDGVRDADVWFPPGPTASIPAPAPPGGPPARLAFVVGNTLWETSTSGSTRALVSAPEGGWLGQVAVSPVDDRVALVIGEPEEQPNSHVVVLGRSGEQWRSARYNVSSISWSRDGGQLALGHRGIHGDRKTTVILDATSGEVVTTHEGVEARWTARGLIGTDMGVRDREADWPQFTRNTVYRLGRVGRAWVTDARALSADPALKEVGGRDLPPWISQIEPSRAGDLVGVWLYRIQSGGYSRGAFVVVDASGHPLWLDPFEPLVGIQDVAWSPTSAYVGMSRWTEAARSAPGAASDQRTIAIVKDGRTGTVVLERPGRFSGWSPHGDWIYVARPEGLFAYPIAGGDGVRVGPYGVQVQATLP